MGYVNASLRETKWSGVKVDGGRFSVKGRIVKMGGGGRGRGNFLGNGRNNAQPPMHGN